MSTVATKNKAMPNGNSKTTAKPVAKTVAKTVAKPVDDSNGRSPLFKKKAIRDMRKGMPGMQMPDGGRATHMMAWDGDASKKRGNFIVYPTIAPIKGKEKSTNPQDWKQQTIKEAAARGEVIKVKSRNRAEKLAAGSWKKGQDRKDAMKAYREEKRSRKAK